MKSTVPTIHRFLGLTGVAVAWAVLGGFIGCTEALHVAANLPDANLILYFAIPIASAVLIGLLLAQSTLEPQSAQPKRTLVVNRLALPVGWLAAAVLCWIVAYRLWTEFKVRAAEIPIRFDKPGKYQLQFTSQVDDPYGVTVELTRNLPFEQMDAFVGGWQGDWYAGDTIGLGLGGFDTVRGRTIRSH